MRRMIMTAIMTMTRTITIANIHGELMPVWLSHLIPMTLWVIILHFHFILKTIKSLRDDKSEEALQNSKQIKHRWMGQRGLPEEWIFSLRFKGAWKDLHLREPWDSIEVGVERGRGATETGPGLLGRRLASMQSECCSVGGVCRKGDPGHGSLQYIWRPLFEDVLEKISYIFH